MLGRIKKKFKKDDKNVIHKCFLFDKYKYEAHVFKSIFHGLFKNIVLRSLALIALHFFTRTGIFTVHALPYVLCSKKKLYYYSLKIKINLGDSIKNESARAKTRGESVERPPPPLAVCLAFKKF